MQSLVIEDCTGEFATPYVNFDLNLMVFEIGGESFMEDTDEYYSPILNWLEEFAETYSEPLVFNFKFLYYNSSTSKSILKMFKILKNYSLKAPLQIYWYYPEDNEDLMQEGKDFQDIVQLDVHFETLVY
ncbi:MAG: DUF1987 domain-containing protein [Microscillaceae bacterium]|nr:DUF1987 domain-containing protein [Microscillaceae bacterium]MDW8459825.1 DUF1987 domain-containing protein [Cytophagales bacterium]